MESGRQHTTKHPGQRGPGSLRDLDGPGRDSAVDSPRGPAAEVVGSGLCASSRPALHERVRSLPPRSVLVFGKSRSRTRQTSGFIEAFEAQGCRVRWVNLGRLRRRFGRRRAPEIAWRVFERFKPDLVFTIFPDLPQELLDRIGASTPVVQWCEQHLEPLEDWQLERLASSDFPLITNPTTVAQLHERGHSHALPVLEAFSRTWHHRIKPRAAVRDLAFIGGPGRDGKRARFLIELAESHPLTVFGRGFEPHVAAVSGRGPAGLELRGPVRPSGYRRICAETRIVLGLNDGNDDAGYWSNRTVMSLACGAFHLTHYVPGIEEVFENGRHLVWFHDLEDCRSKIAHYLSRPEERRRIAEQGHDLVHLRHRWHDRVADLFHLLRERTERSARLGSKRS